MYPVRSLMKKQCILYFCYVWLLMTRKREHFATSIPGASCQVHAALGHCMRNESGGNTISKPADHQRPNSSKKKKKKKSEPVAADSATGSDEAVLVICEGESRNAKRPIHDTSREDSNCPIRHRAQNLCMSRGSSEQPSVSTTLADVDWKVRQNERRERR